MRKAGNLTIHASTLSFFFITIMMMSTGNDVTMSIRPGLVETHVSTPTRKR